MNGAPTQILNQLTGGLISSFLGGGGGGGIGGGGNFPGGDIQGTQGNLYGRLPDMKKLFPGDRHRHAEGEECEEHASADGAEGPLSGGDTQVMAFVGDPREMNGNIGPAIQNVLESSAPAKTYGPGSVDQMLSDLEAAAADTSGKQYVVVFACHGSPGNSQGPGNWAGGSPGGGWARGVQTVDFENALIRGADGAGNKDLSHITVVDGACFPCRGPWMATQQAGRGMTPINHARHVQDQTRMQTYDPISGNTDTAKGFVGMIEQFKQTMQIGGAPDSCGPGG